MSDSTPERLIRPELRALSAYAVEDAAGMVKLDAMENPYPWPEELRAAWTASLSSVDVNRYPDPAGRRVKERLREALALPKDREIILGNGSDELIQIVIATMAAPGARVLTVTPSFVMYRRCAVVAGLGCDEVPLKENGFSLDREALLEKIASDPPSVAFFAYPNNPTGNVFDDGDLAAIVESVRCPVVIDEAYEPFAGRSWLQRAGAHDHILVMRTVSKLGLAGLRLGYMVGHPMWIEQFEKVRLPYNVNVLTQHSAEFALQHYEMFRHQAALIRDQRERLYQSMNAIDGISVWPSAANFLLFKSTLPAAELFDALKRRGILVKNLDGSAPLLEDCLRVTVSTPEDNRLFLAALEASFAELR